HWSCRKRWACVGKGTPSGGLGSRSGKGTTGAEYGPEGTQQRKAGREQLSTAHWGIGGRNRGGATPCARWGSMGRICIFCRNIPLATPTPHVLFLPFLPPPTCALLGRLGLCTARQQLPERGLR